MKLRILTYCVTATHDLISTLNSILAWIIHEVSSQKSKDALKG